MRLCNSGVLAAGAADLAAFLAEVRNDNAKGEYYLTDVIAMAVADGINVHGIKADNWTEVMGINDKKQLAEAQRALQALVAGQTQHLAHVVGFTPGHDRFAAEPGVVTDLGGHYLAGMHDAGMRSCGKHFPGHGSVEADSHTDDVTDPRGDAVLKQAVKYFRWFSRKREVSRLVLHSFAHLAEERSSPEFARDLLQELGGRLGGHGFEVHHTPFGWSLQWTMSVEGHGYAKTFKSL